VFFELAYQAYLPRLVEHEQLTEGNSKLMATFSLAEIGGPGLASGLVHMLTAPFAIVIDAVSFAVSAVGFLLIRRAEPTPPTPMAGTTMRQEIREGFRETFRNRYLTAFAGEAATYNVFWSMINVVLVLYVVRELGRSAGTLGLLLSVGSVGALLGAVLTPRLSARFGVGPTIVATSVLGAVAPLLIPVAGGPTVGATIVLGVAFFLRGAGVTGCNVQVASVRQTVTPDYVLGRTNAVYRLLTHGFVPLGALIGGFLGDRIGLQPTLLIGAIGVSLSWLWLFFSPARTLRELPTAPDISV
jgi:MFS-type transporter involved in bile tolerance (Atg22 family)